MRKSGKVMITLIMLSSAVSSSCGNLATIDDKDKNKENAKVHVIIDTDVAADYGDVGALAVLHALADSGRAEILATISCNQLEKSVQLIQLINNYYNKPDIPIGVTKGQGANVDTWHQGEKWTEELLKRYPYSHPVSSQTTDALNVYRKVLSQSPDSSVTIVGIGFLTNLKNLLLSDADEISPLSGLELVSSKVKQLVLMAGIFPNGREYNIYVDVESAKNVFEKWPTTILVSGYEIGRYIRNGDRLIQSGIKESPIKDAYEISTKQDWLEFDNSRYEMGGRASYDQTAVLVAVEGADNYFSTESGTVTINEDGSNGWQPSSTGKHVILKHKRPLHELSQIIENLMMHEPKTVHE